MDEAGEAGFGRQHAAVDGGREALSRPGSDRVEERVDPRRRERRCGERDPASSLVELAQLTAHHVMERGWKWWWPSGERPSRTALERRRDAQREQRVSARQLEGASQGWT